MSKYTFKKAKELQDFLNFHLSVDRDNIKASITLYRDSDLAVGEVVKYQKSGMFFWLSETDTMLFPCDEFHINILDTSTGCEQKLLVSDFIWELTETATKNL